MRQTMFAIGIDISKDFFTSSCVTPAVSAHGLAFDILWTGWDLPQTDTGWRELLDQVQSRRIAREACQMVMECTGVYSEQIAHYLFAQGYAVFMEPPGKIKLGFYERGKTDTVDSRQIAEYAFRFADRLHPWQPRDVLVEQIAASLALRDTLSTYRAAYENRLKALRRKQQHLTGILTTYETLQATTDAEIDRVDREVRRLVAQHPTLNANMERLLSIPNVGFQLAAQVLVCTNGFTEHLDAPQIASFAGIAPRPYQSGSSVHRPAKADHAGPARLRKLLYLAAMRLRKNSPEFKTYFERKVAEGKAPRLVLHNIENKCLKLMCGVLKSGKPYISGYRSTKSSSISIETSIEKKHQRRRKGEK